jgi:hypothetical protein
MQTDCAFWNVGDDGLNEEFPENPPFLFGSGKSGTPCDRMHCAYASACASPDTGDADDDADEDEGAPATPGPLDPPEHPAASTAAPSTATAASPARRPMPLRQSAGAIPDIADIPFSFNRN